MTNNMTTQPDDTKSIFAAAAELPAPGAQQFHAEVDMTQTNIDLLDHGPEQEAIKGADAELGVSIPERPEHEMIPMNNPVILKDPAGEMKAQIEKSFSGVYDFGHVEVTPEERDRFVRAAMHDTEMWFDVTLEGVESAVRVAMPPEAFTTAASNAAYAWGKQGVINAESDVQWYLAFQQMHAWMQVREINHEPAPWAGMFEEGLPKMSAMRAHLNEPDNFEAFFVMSPSRWRMIVESMRIAEAKYRMCLEAWRDRSFFTTAGTA